MTYYNSLLNHDPLRRILQTVYKFSFLSVFSILMLLASSCEKVIDPDLRIAEPSLVIDGSINDQLENHLVKISKTIPFDQDNTFNGVKGAKVTLSAVNKAPIIFAEVTDGVYRSPRFRGVPGTTYNLEVITEGTTYKASSTMPLPVKPDSISFKRLTFLGKSNVYPAVYYKDPPLVQNQYRYVLYVNHKFTADIVTEDRFNNGNSVSDLILFEGDGIEHGDRVDLETQTIDRNVFKYYFAISQISGNGGPPVAPSNPVSNFDNGALGIFNACTESAYSLTLK